MFRPGLRPVAIVIARREGCEPLHAAMEPNHYQRYGGVAWMRCDLHGHCPQSVCVLHHGRQRNWLVVVRPMSYKDDGPQAPHIYIPSVSAIMMSPV